MHLVWEYVSNEDNGVADYAPSLRRARVDGGWLYASSTAEGSALAFVPNVKPTDTEEGTTAKRCQARRRSPGGMQCQREATHKGSHFAETFNKAKVSW